MLISPNYLEQFEREFDGPEAIALEQPDEIPLTTFEERTNTRSLDSPTGGEYPYSFYFIHRDFNSSEVWDFKNDESLRETFAWLDGEPFGYLFDGLWSPEDLRVWFRLHLGLPAQSPSEEAWLEHLRQQLVAEGKTVIILDDDDDGVDITSPTGPVDEEDGADEDVDGFTETEA